MKKAIFFLQLNLYGSDNFDPKKINARKCTKTRMIHGVMLN